MAAVAAPSRRTMKSTIATRALGTRGIARPDALSVHAASPAVSGDGTVAVTVFFIGETRSALGDAPSSLVSHEVAAATLSREAPNSAASCSTLRNWRYCASPGVAMDQNALSSAAALRCFRCTTSSVGDEQATYDAII